MTLYPKNAYRPRPETQINKDKKIYSKIPSINTILLKFSGPDLILMHDRMRLARLKTRLLFIDVGSMAISEFCQL